MARAVLFREILAGRTRSTDEGSVARIRSTYKEQICLKVKGRAGRMCSTGEG
jgi:hypothetical protein